MGGGGRSGGYSSFVDCLSRLTINYASVVRWSKGGMNL